MLSLYLKLAKMVYKVTKLLGIENYYIAIICELSHFSVLNAWVLQYAISNLAHYWIHLYGLCGLLLLLMEWGSAIRNGWLR